MKKIKVGILIGSLRKESYSKAVAKSILQIAPSNMDMSMIEIGHLPFYNQDYEADYPTSYRDFKEQIKKVDALLFITPEYNRSIPAVLKNALDVASRPYGASAWNGKPAAVISQSPGTIGGFGANSHLCQIASCLNIKVMQQPECCLANITEALNENGELTCKKTIAYLSTVLTAFENWCKLFLEK